MSLINYFLLAAIHPIIQAAEDLMITVEDELAQAPLNETSLLQPSNESTITSFKNFMRVTNSFTEEMEARAIELLDLGVNYQLCHRRFTSISATSHLSSVIGMSIRSFHLLFSLNFHELFSFFKSVYLKK